MDGIIIIDKEKNLTSRDIVNKYSKKLGIKKIGHTGTLDPLATGVLVLCVGKGTKLVDLITGYDKVYIAKVCLGLLTDTYDITGNVLKEKEVKPTKNEIIEVLNSFEPGYEQEVPIYSAVKISGKKLYEYARNNEKVELPKRYVQIKEIKLISNIEYINGKTYFSFITTVSKGTYIRSLINDIGKKLNTYGTMVELRRVRQGNFKIEEASDNIISIENVLKDYFKIEMNEELYKKISNGVKIKDEYNKEYVVFTYNKKVIALYKKEGDYLKSYKMF